MSSTESAPASPEQPAITEPETAESATPEPEAAEPAVAQPETAEPAVAEPPATEAEVVEPPATEPETAEPATPEPEAAEPAAAAPARPAVPSALPGRFPRPGAAPAKPAAAAKPTATAQPASDEAASPAAPTANQPWGRAEDDGTVSVREGDEWRVVGQYPDGTPAEALAYFQRKFQDLAAKVRLLEQRKQSGGAAASDLSTAAGHLRAEINGAAAVGNLASLDARVAALTESLSAVTEAEAAKAREAVDVAIAERTALVEKAEALAARDPKTTQWKQTSAELTSLFDSWQSQQTKGPRLSKSVSQQLWKRFRDARATVEKHRREFYAELDDTHKAARDQKTKLAERAEALVPKGEDGIGSYRTLLDEWKTVGRAGKKVDDALWARFKAAGDAIYGARIERDEAEVAESQPRIEEKRALLTEAAGVANIADTKKARALLTSVQRKWDEVGRISPRDKERGLDDELRKIETALRGREDVDWKSNNPETKARAGDMSRQLNEAIQKLEAQLDKATQAGDKTAIAKAQEALDARVAWLKALGG